jgi:hypothetical protein
MSRKIWAALIALSLGRSASCLFREGEDQVIHHGKSIKWVSLPLCFHQSTQSTHNKRRWRLIHIPCKADKKIGFTPIMLTSVCLCVKQKKKKKQELSHRHGRERTESSCIIQKKIWVTPIDLFLHLTTIKMKVYNDVRRLDNSESRGDQRAMYAASCNQFDEDITTLKGSTIQNLWEFKVLYMALH